MASISLVNLLVPIISIGLALLFLYTEERWLDEII